MPGNFILRIEGLDKAKEKFSPRAFAARLKQGMRLAVIHLEGEVKRRVPVMTGRLRASIGHRVVDDGWMGIVGTNVKYARFVEEGTQPHEIRPRRKKALHWGGKRHGLFARYAAKITGRKLVWDGITVKRVQHPGTKPQPYFGPALEANKDFVMRIIAAALEGRFG